MIHDIGVGLSEDYRTTVLGCTRSHIGPARSQFQSIGCALLWETDVVLVRDLANKVRIAEGFPADYEMPEGSDKVYYVDANREEGEIHFTVPTNQIEFDSYHVSRVYSGKNGQIWYKKGDITKKESGMN